MDGSNFNGWRPEGNGGLDEAARSAIRRSATETVLFLAAVVLLAVLFCYP